MFPRPRRIFRLLGGCLLLLVLIYASPWLFLPFTEEEGAKERAQEESAKSSKPNHVTVIPPRVSLAKHTYDPSGLLQVNPLGPHPIFELMREAEREWDRKIRVASSGLDEAILEYRRRYRRRPPRGFDKWWEYVLKHDVKLPDEYDSIYHDLEPFWGIQPATLLAIRSELESKVDSYTIGKDEDTDPISVLNTSFAEGRYDQLIKGSVKILDILGDVEEFLPPFRAVFSPHDGPNRLSDYNVKQTALEAAADSVLLARPDLPPITPKGWLSACADTSPSSLLYPINLDNPPPPKPAKTFIHDHRKAMDPCLHPDLLWHHGQFLSHNAGPAPQKTMVPEFAYCSTTIHHNIRIPTPYAWVADVQDDPEWDDKLDERLLWRGSNTGIFHAEHTRWRNSHRISVVEKLNNLNGTISLLVPPESPEVPVGPAKTLRKSRVNPALFDIAFAGRPTACKGNVCKQLEELMTWRERQSIKQAGNYRYVLDVDGNGWSGRFKRLITSNSVIFKSTIYPEWYMDRIAPWLHYVPVQVDLSDLHDSLAFFRGDCSGDGDCAHEDLARKIAKAGREWSKTFWRREDLVAYFFRLILEYARVMSLDREGMTFEGDGIDDF
ncbi:glycosyl transferase family 90-domain-containing protein [Mycena floridula]|nr:glycosyl transferase family 90-domain-containing protein [Mycena floridula]